MYLYNLYALKMISTEIQQVVNQLTACHRSFMPFQIVYMCAHESVLLLWLGICMCVKQQSQQWMDTCMCVCMHVHTWVCTCMQACCTLRCVCVCVCVGSIGYAPSVCFCFSLKNNVSKTVRERTDGEKELKKDTVRWRRGGKKEKRKSSNWVQVTQPIPSLLTFIPLFAQRSCCIL